ncbi:nitroreductase family protein [Roseixanthobacter glucoisosaccharinicivorans]|uniref:nitroreductase family protein n=1 Tax=Roseixanthobacter glucoisosaccharinicivorans TaxID=3119923 RepID=UPI00372728AE
MTITAPQALSAVDTVLAYHARTKHSLARYAPGPETLDWDAQPDPFRVFAGAPRVALPLAAHALKTRFSQIFDASPRPAALNLDSVALLLEVSFGLAAWKAFGPDRWALRCNPSSGNLHPTEVYALTAHVTGLADGLHHYVSRDHVLEQRCHAPASPGSAPRLWIGLSSIHWREAWKYGERAFRYCQLDIGHALGALRYAAGALGWSARIVEGYDAATLAAMMGLDRPADFSGVEPEDADVIVALEPAAKPVHREVERPTPADLAGGDWAGRASLLDPHPLYRWPIIAEVSRATRATAAPVTPAALPARPALTGAGHQRAAEILLGRRSAQRFDSRFEMPRPIFFRMLDAVLPRAAAPWDIWPHEPALHPILFVHRVEGLPPGLYALPRSEAAGRALRTALRADFVWEPVEGTPAHLPLVRLVQSDCRGIARTVSCHQAIASDSCFAMSMLAQFEGAVRTDPSHYRQLHWEAGLLGHVLYLEAETAGLRGTGIGCFFDDALHELLGLATLEFQSLYHFTVGRPLSDDRITTEPAYEGRAMLPERG